MRFIERNPKIYSTKYKGTRKHLTKRFPYRIIYLVEKDKIIALAITHGKKSLALLKERIKI
jgi:hypothetical protein